MKKLFCSLSILAFALSFIVVPLVFAHSGRTDANGGHYNRKTGEYHYHSGPRVAPPDDSSTSQNIEGVVYITRTGKKYHSSGCRYLSHSKIAIDIKEALEQGYTACSVCGGVPYKK